MKCLNCQEETVNQKFCSKSCSAKYNNMLYPKRKPEGKCKNCQKPINSTKTYCSESCVEISKNKKLGTKKCADCKKTFPRTCENFYKRSDRLEEFQSYCKDCYNKKTSKRKRETKELFVKYKGGKCIICGYNKNNCALDFHHTDPSKKEYDQETSKK